MRRVTLSSRARYRFDNLVSRGSGALIAMLAIVSAALVFLIASAAWLFNLAPEGQQPEPGLEGLEHLLWMGFMRTFDAGTMGGDQGSAGFLLSMLAFTVVGICVFSMFIGLLTAGIQSKVEELRKGRSLVFEKNHELVLGWSSKIFTIVDQLIEAKQSERRPRIVVLAEKDKVAMEDELRARVRPPGRVKIVCRTGSPIDIGDLEIVNPDEAKSILVLSPEDDDPDAGALKAVLALVNNPDRQNKKYHIVAELQDRKNIEVAKMVAGAEIETIDAHTLISRLMVQTCRQSGLSAVYSELLDFGGVEIYFTDAAPLVGRMFGEVLMAYEQSAVIGVRTADGETLLKPPGDTLLRTGDQLIVVAEDDSSIRITGASESDIDVSAILDDEVLPPKPERTLILGWNEHGTRIIRELDQYVAPGSEIVVVADLGDHAADIARECTGLASSLLRSEIMDTTDRLVLDRLEVPTFDHVILLCYSAVLPPQKADARTLVTLLHLRRIAAESGSEFSIVTEMLDVRNRQLAESTRADDFIVSDRLVSLLMTQVAESKDLNAVFEELFEPTGAEIYLKPLRRYVELGKTVSFRTLVASARKRGETAIGYRKAVWSKGDGSNHGVVLNPPKSARLKIEAGDRIVVLADQ